MTYATKPLLEPDQAEVEKAVAFGRSDAWICDRYRINPSQVAAVRAYLEKVNGEPDGEAPGAGRPRGASS